MGEHIGLYEREKLYEEVWKEPALVVAKRYGVSSVALAKACGRLAVPLPPRGHWAKVRAGRKSAPRPPLPPYERLPQTNAAQLDSRESARTAGNKVHDKKSRDSTETATPTGPEAADSSSHMDRKNADRKRNHRKTSPWEVTEYLYMGYLLDTPNHRI